MLSAEDQRKVSELVKRHLEPQPVKIVPPTKKEINLMVVEVLEDIGIGEILAECPDIKDILKDYYRSEILEALSDAYGVKEEDIDYDD